MRLILVTFAMLGWCFYVVSGGPDFEPRGQRGAAPEHVAAAPKPTPKPTPVQNAQQTAEQLVTNVAARTVPARAEPAPVIASGDVVVSIDQPQEATLSGFSTFADQGTNLTLASLEDGAAGLQQVAVATQTDAAPEPIQPEPQKDIREISGTRVNMRDGPGTIYPVIGKATIGQKVEILSESGTGWLRLRVLPEQQIGWVSASLVRKTTN